MALLVRRVNAVPGRKTWSRREKRVRVRKTSLSLEKGESK